MKCRIWLALAFGLAATAVAGPFDATLPGRSELAAIDAADPRISGWAAGVAETKRGPIDITKPESSGGLLATFGEPMSALGPPDALSGGFPSTDPTKVISLGDGGSITLTFNQPIANHPGPDFAVFENAFNDTFLELAFVEVSSNGTDFFRFPTVSLTPLTSQIDQTVAGHDAIDATNIDGFAGKYRVGKGTPFDLQRLVGVGGALDVNGIRYVRIRDVIGWIGGSVAAGTASEDSASTYGFFGLSFGANHIVNDPWRTDFPSGGFDLDAVAVLAETPEPHTTALLLAGMAACALRRGRRRR